MLQSAVLCEPLGQALMFSTHIYKAALQGTNSLHILHTSEAWHMCVCCIPKPVPEAVTQLQWVAEVEGKAVGRRAPAHHSHCWLLCRRAAKWAGGTLSASAVCSYRRQLSGIVQPLAPCCLTCCKVLLRLCTHVNHITCVCVPCAGLYQYSPYKAAAQSGSDITHVVL